MPKTNLEQLILLFPKQQQNPVVQYTLMLETALSPQPLGYSTLLLKLNSPQVSCMSSKHQNLGLNLLGPFTKVVHISTTALPIQFVLYRKIVHLPIFMGTINQFIINIIN